QYGSVPPKGAILRFTSYRHGGGREGNVTASTLSVLKSTIAGIDTVTNPDAATGGVDAEIITHARQRASMEIRSRYRAVTAEYLDERRLIGTTVELKPCRYRGLSVVVNLQARPLADTARVEEDVAHALYTYLNPLVGGNPTGPGQGWPFGRALNQGELYGVVHAVDGVEFVRILRLYETNLETGEQSAKPAGTHIVLEPDELM